MIMRHRQRAAAIWVWLLLLASPARAQADDSAEARWRVLNQATISADKTGDYPSAEVAAKKALDLARASLGSPDDLFKTAR
jgi:hypothetical protein